mgnify:CR=1 FL=1
MALNPGDDWKTGNGQVVGEEDEFVAGEDLTEGGAVKLNGSGEVVHTEGDGTTETLIGFAYLPAASGEHVVVKSRGEGVVQVADDVDGTTGLVGSHDGTSNADVGAGDLSGAGDEYYVVSYLGELENSAGTTENYAKVVRR